MRKTDIVVYVISEPVTSSIAFVGVGGFHTWLHCLHAFFQLERLNFRGKRERVLLCPLRTTIHLYAKRGKNWKVEAEVTNIFGSSDVAWRFGDKKKKKWTEAAFKTQLSGAQRATDGYSCPFFFWLSSSSTTSSRVISTLRVFFSSHRTPPSPSHSRSGPGSDFSACNPWQAKNVGWGSGSNGVAAVYTLL